MLKLLERKLAPPLVRPWAMKRKLGCLGVLVLSVSLLMLAHDASAAVAFRNSSNAWAGPGTSLTINKPAAVVDNDVMLLVFYMENTTLVPSVAGTWTLIDNIANGTYYNTYVYYRRASAEPASYAITWDGSSRVVAAAIVAYSGVITTGSPVDVYSKLVNAYTPSMTATGVTPANTDDMLVFLGTHYTSTFTATPPTDMLERNDSNSVYAADQLLATGAPTGDKTATLSGSSISTGFLVALTASQVVTPNHLATACTATSPYTTASIAPGANRLVLLWVNDRGTGNPTVTSVAGNGLTWVQVNTLTFGSNGRLTLYRAMGAAPTAGTVTITFSGTIARACWSIVEYDGVDTSGTDGSGAVVQSVTGTAASTSLTVTLAAFADANNVATGGFSTTSNSTYTAGGGFSIYGSAAQSTSLSIATEGLPTNDTTVDISVASTTIAGIAVEVRKQVTCTAVSDASYVAANAQSGQAIVYWSSSNAALILRKSGSAITDAPANGTSYWVGNTIGASSVVYNGSVAETSFTQTGLTNGTTYYYKVFPKSGTCYAPGISVTARPVAGPIPAWSYMMANGSTMKGGIAGQGSVNTAGNFARIISLNTAAGTQTWAPVATTAAVQGWLTWIPNSYPYRQPLTVTAGSAAVPSGYSVSVTINHASLVSAGKSQADGDDLRVFYWNGTTWVQLDRVLDSGSAWNSATTKIWFKTQAAIAASGTDSNYYLYYGNPTAASPPANKANVFLFFDDFEGGTLSKWTILSGSWQVATDQKHGGTRSLKYPAESGTSDK